MRIIENLKDYALIVAILYTLFDFLILGVFLPPFMIFSSSLIIFGVYYLVKSEILINFIKSEIEGIKKIKPKH